LGKVDVILTTGGTGLSSRDVMPEVTRGLIDLEIPGMAEAMRAESLKVTKMAMISRAVAGARGSTLIINLPGSTGGVRDNLSVVLPVIDHAVEVIQDRQAGDHPI
jgi:molybdopterin adenylyltransferase